MIIIACICHYFATHSEPPRSNPDSTLQLVELLQDQIFRIPLDLFKDIPGAGTAHWRPAGVGRWGEGADV